MCSFAFVTHTDLSNLLEGLRGQISVDELEPVFVQGQMLHVAVSLPIMKSNRCQVVECRVQILLNVSTSKRGKRTISDTVERKKNTYEGNKS